MLGNLIFYTTFPKRKMAKVKLEHSDTSECEGSDVWLAHWSNPSQARLKKEEPYDKKSNQISIKAELQNSDEMETVSSESELEADKVQASAKRFNLDHKSDIGKKCKSQSRAKVAESKDSNIESQNKNTRCSSSLEEQLLTSTVSNTVENLCKYQCRECKEFHWGRVSLSRHLKKTNHAIITQGSLNKYLVQVVAHKCYICMEKILCDKATIANHLKRKHKMPLKEYADNTDVVSLKRSHLVLATKIRLEDSESTMTFSEALKHAKVSDIVKNQCKYQCPKCNSYYTTRKTMRGHLARSKHEAIAARDFGIRKYLVRIVAHKCHICEEKILCEKEAILLHVKNRHGITSLIGYCDKNAVEHEINGCVRFITKKQIGNGDIKREELDTEIPLQEALEQVLVSDEVASLCKFKCQACKKVYNASRSFRDHMIKAKHASIDRGGMHKHLMKIVAHKCYICSKKVLCDQDIILKHLRCHKLKSLQAYSNATNALFENKSARRLKDFESFCAKKFSKEEISNNIANLCKFSCKNCSYSSNNWSYMVRHLNTNNHGPTLSPTEHATLVVLHKCYVCGCLMLCDIAILTNHLQKHKLTITSYKTCGKVSTEKELLTQYHHELRVAMKDVALVSPKAQCVLSSDCLSKCDTTCSVGNLCFFKCFYCNKSDMSFGSFRSHLLKKHNCKSWSYKPECVVEARYHKCLICAKTILCDNHILRSHLINHKTNLKQYVNNYVVQHGGKVFPTFQDFRRDSTVFEMLKAKKLPE